MAAAPDIKLIVTDGDGCMLPLGSLPERNLVKKLLVAMRLGIGYTDLALVTANSYSSECVRLASKIGITAYFETGNKRLHEGEVSFRVGADDMEFLGCMPDPCWTGCSLANSQGIPDPFSRRSHCNVVSHSCRRG